MTVSFHFNFFILLNVNEIFIFCVGPPGETIRVPANVEAGDGMPGEPGMMGPRGPPGPPGERGASGNDILR